MEMYQTVPFLDTQVSYDRNRPEAADSKTEKGESFSDALNQELSQGEKVQTGETQQKGETPSEPGKEKETAVPAAALWMLQNPLMQQLTAADANLTAALQKQGAAQSQQTLAEVNLNGLAGGTAKADQAAGAQMQQGEQIQTQPIIPETGKGIQPEKGETELADTLKAYADTGVKAETKPLETADEKDHDLLKPVKEQTEPETLKENKNPELIQTDRTAESSRNVSFREAKPVQTASDVDMTDVKAGIQKLAESMDKQMAKGRTEFEIWLEPANLGKLAIKVAYESGKAMISITCLNDKTMELISQNAKNLGHILEQHTGTNTVVIVDQPETDYLQQKMDQEGQGGYSGEEQQDRKDDDSDGDSQSFLQQLRLGLM